MAREIKPGDGGARTGEQSAERIIHAIRMLVRALDILSRRLASEAGVTSAQLLCLRHVAQAGAATVTEIADNVHLSPSTVVGIVDRLEEKGLVVRERDTKDRRVVFVSPTRLGGELVSEAKHPVQALFEDRTEDGLSDGDYERIARALEDIVRALGAEEEEGKKPLDAIGPVDGVSP